MKNRPLLFLIVLGLMAFSSCRDKELDMTLVQKTLFQNEVINEISAADGWYVTIVQDDAEQYVELNYSAFLESYVVVQKEGDKLTIGFNQSVRLPNGSMAKAVIHLNTMSKLALSDAAYAMMEGTFESPSFVMELEDAAACRGGSFNGNFEARLSDASVMAEMTIDGVRCNIVLEDASVFKGDIFASERMDVSASDASRLTVYGGRAPLAVVELEDASSLNTISMTISEMQVGLKDASEAFVNVTNSISGVLRNSSVLQYKGDPDLNLDCDDSSKVQPY